MKKLIIIGTKADSGKGGISTALTGYIDGLKINGVDYEFVVSHDGEKNTVVCWGRAFFRIVSLAIKHRSKAVFWFHCGPWFSMTRKFTLALVPRLLGAETLGHIHSPTFSHYLGKGRLSRTLLKVSLLPYNKIIALTPWWRSLMLENGIRKPIVISPNPNSSISCQVAKKYIEVPKKTNGIRPTKILTMARIVEGKGIDTVIDAMDILPEHFTLTIAGEGNKLDEYRSRASQSVANERIEFTGWIDGKVKDNLMREADIFCLPSTYDSFGMVFIEAMAYDLPIVAYGWGPINDVVTPDVGECCVKVTAEEVAEKMRSVSNDTARYIGFGPEKVLKNYTPEQAAKNIIELL